MPRWTLDVDDTVRTLSPAGFRQFHAGVTTVGHGRP